MSHGERAYPHGQRRKGRERRGRRNRCKKIGDAKMRFQKVAATFPCAAHANSFTRVPGRNAAIHAGWGAWHMCGPKGSGFG